MRCSPSRLPLWFWMGLSSVWTFALACRFWRLERFNTLIFDEVYFAQFGYKYLTQTPFFDAHPPLGKYLIALGIALKGFNTWGFRWINALMGAAIPLIVAGIAYQLCKRPSYALMAAALASLDGLLLVESRYALLNIHLLFFGLLAHWLVLMALNYKGYQRQIGLGVAGVCFGATLAVKWNGLGFLLGLYLLWGVAKIGRLSVPKNQKRWLPIQTLPELTWFQLFVYLPAIALLIYSILWLPHLAQNPDFNFWQVHQQIFHYHRQVGGGSVHPFCSAWYTWPLLLKPISYFYQVTQSTFEPIPVTGPPLPQAAANWIYSVYATGNPILWWASTVAIFGLLLWGGQQFWQCRQYRQGNYVPGHSPGEQTWVPLYVGCNYLANFLPWIGVSRCTFLYHYMPASMFSGLTLAWLIERGLQSPHVGLQRVAIILIATIILSFMLTLPLWWGLPLSPRQWQLLQGL